MAPHCQKGTWLGAFPLQNFTDFERHIYFQKKALLKFSLTRLTTLLTNCRYSTFDKTAVKPNLYYKTLDHFITQEVNL